MALEWAVVGFESKLQRALERVRLVLEAAKTPCFAGEVHHRYEDKYLLAECLTNTAAASQLNCLLNIGLGAEQVAQLREWARTSAVSLRLRAEERCSFVREETRDVESPTKRVEELSVGGAVQAAVTSKVVTKVTEYFWKLEESWELLAVRGVGEQPTDRLSIADRTGRDELKTTAKRPPRPEATVPAFEAEVNISWLLRQLPADGLSPSFQIDRSHAKCHTPRRNPNVDEASSHFHSFESWAGRVASFLTSLLGVQPDPARKFDTGSLASDAVFVPVMPLFQGAEDAEGAGTGGQPAAAEEANVAGVLARLAPAAEPPTSALLAFADVNRLLAEEARTLGEQRAVVTEAFPGGDAVATAAEARLIVALRHCARVCSQWDEAVDYIEGLLRKQLISAIGKEVSPADFAEYMRFHNRKLFAKAYAPAPFCFAVRRSEAHAPEGTLSIEEEVTGPGGDSNIASPIFTLAARSTRPHPMQFPLSASTNVHFAGDRYLHAWLSHNFSGQSGAQLSLVSRARQFSSMLVLVGRIASASTFEPKYAAIVKNKDELTIPLDLSTIPTPKEFKDAIESLSPEQQAFAKAFRAMQLESTLFGVLVIQIKPQLEKVLNLPADSLTKEIKLTQDLMQLFIEYQIPSDLLSFDGGIGADGAELVAPSVSDRLGVVKGHVKAMQDMIQGSKEEEVADRRRQHQFLHPDAPECKRAVSEAFSDFSCRDEACDDAKVADCDLLDMDACAFAAPVMRSCAFEAPMEACSTPMVEACEAPIMDACALEAPMPRAVPAPPAPAPAAQQPQPAPAAQQQPATASAGAGQAVAEEAAVDYTKVPKEMDRQFERLDVDGCLRPTIIKPSDVWTKRAQKALLASPTVSTLYIDEQKREKDAAFDLLDALTKSGALPVEHASLHIMVAATHCFDRTVTETVVRDNINPINKVERSTLIMAMTVHQQPVSALIQESECQRVNSASPALFLEN